MCIKGFRAVTYYNKNKYNKKNQKTALRVCVPRLKILHAATKIEDPVWGN